MTNHQQQVLMMPDYRQDNPYQFLLATELQGKPHSINLNFASGYRRVFPLFRGVKDSKATVLHLHWLTPYLKGENWLVKSVYSCKLIIDLGLVRLIGVKIVWTIHNHLSHNTQFPKLELWLRRNISQVAHQIIVHNHSTAKYVQQAWKINPKLSIIRHGHYRDYYPPAISQQEAKTKLNLPSDGYLYLNLGMIRPYKGIENLLQQWQTNQTVLESHTLLIAGKPCDVAYEAQITALAMAKRAIFQPGFIPESQMHLYFSAADVVVLPFTNILTSGSLILAMSYHKPIIAPRQGGIAETLFSADDLLYHPKDNRGLANSLKASTKIDLTELSSRVEIACNRLNWDKIAQLTAELYRN